MQYFCNYYNLHIQQVRAVVFFVFLILIGFNNTLPLVAHASTDINEQIHYQGLLQDSSGNNVTDGNYDIVFKLYSTSSGGIALWTGTHTTANGNAVAVTDGIFNVLLGSGSGNSLSSVDFNQDTLYLSITVGSDSEMTPRQRVGAVAYAFNADTLDGVGLATSSLSVGDILYFDGTDLERLAAGTNGQVLKLASGIPSWAADISGGTGFFATSSDSLVLYPNDTTDVLVLGGSATTTSGNIFETIGSALIGGALTTYNTVTGPSFVATSTAASSTVNLLNVATAFELGSDYITDFTGTGLVLSGNALTVDSTTFFLLSDWFGTTTAPHLTTLEGLTSMIATSATTTNATSTNLAVLSTTALTNTTNSGTFTVSGLTTLGNASTTNLSVSGNLYTGLTLNGVSFIGSNGLLTEDSANFVWDDANNRLGIGTSSPGAALAVSGAGLFSSVLTSEGLITGTSFTNGTLNLGTTAAGEIDTISGNLMLDSAGGTVSIDDELAVSATTTLSSVLSLSNNRILNVGAPTQSTDAANKDYVDAFAQGLVWQEPVLTSGSTTPPSSPSNGDRHIVGVGATGAWASHDYKIAEWNGSSWTFASSTVGFSTFVSGANQQQTYNGTEWVELGGSTSHTNLSGLQGGNGSDQFYHLNLTDWNALTDVNAQLTALHTDAAPTFASTTLSLLRLNSEDITDLTGDGLLNLSGVLSVSTSTFLTRSDWFSTTTIPHITTAEGLTSLIATSATTTNATSTNFHVSGALSLGNALPVANGGTGTTTAQTGGLFFYDGSTFTQDATNLFWDNVNKRLGVGTSSPGALVTIHGTIGHNLLQIATTTNQDVFVVSENGMVGIGTASPGQALQVDGNIQLSNSNLGVVLDGQDRPLITRGFDVFSSGNYSGIGRWGLFMEPGTLTLGVPNKDGARFQVARYSEDSTVASIPLRIDDTGYIGVGIGSTTPTHMLSIGGAIGLSSTSTPSATSNALYNQDGTLHWDGNALQTLLNNTEGYALTFDSSNAAVATSSLFFAQSGSIGIGTTSPTAILHVDNGTNTFINIEGDTFSTLNFSDAESTTVGGIIYSHTNDRMTFRTSSGDRIYINSSGRLGIGEASPGSLLSVSGGATFGASYDTTAAPTNGLLVEGNVGLGTTSPATHLHINHSDYAAIQFGNNNSDGFHITKEAGDNSFNIWNGEVGSSTNRFRINNNGNVGIGTVSPEYNLHVSGSGNSRFLLESSDNANTEINIRNASSTWSVYNAANAGGLRFYQGSDLMTLSNDGNLGIGSTSPSNKLVVGGGIGLVSATPSVTDNALYNQSGTLYWNGSALGASVSGTEGQTVVFDGSAAQTATSTLFIASTTKIAVGGHTSNPEALLDIGSATTQADWLDTSSVKTLPYGNGATHGLVIEQRHSANKDSDLGYAGPVIDFRVNNSSSQSWSVGQITGVADPGSSFDFSGGLVFSVGSSGTSDQPGRRTGGTDPYAAMIIDTASRVGIVDLTPKAQFSVKTVPGRDAFHLFGPNDVERFTVTDTGLVGIGEVSPFAPLHITASSTISGRPDYNILLEESSGGENYALGVDSAGGLVFLRGGIAQALYLSDIDERVVIGGGTSTPATNLVVADSDTFSRILIQDSVTGYESNDGFGLGVNDDQEAFVWNYESTPLFFGTNNTEHMRFTPTGLVGVGTSSPEHLLHVYGSGNERIFLESAGNENVELNLKNNQGTWSIYNAANADGLKFYNGSDHMVLTTAGRLGIGTTSPGAILHVDGGSNTFINIEGDTASTINLGDAASENVGSISYSHLSNVLTFRTNGTDQAYIDDNGYLGIGTSSPAQRLHVEGSGNERIRIQSTSNQNTELEIINTTSAWSIYNKGSNGYLMLNSGGDLVTVDTDGEIGIGTTNPQVPLHIDDGANTVMRLEGDAGGFSTIQFANPTNNDTGRIVYGHAGTEDKYQIYVNDILRQEIFGNDGNHAFHGDAGRCDINGSLNCSSDERVKENVLDLPYGLETVTALRPVTYNLKDPNLDQKTQLGFIAQEVNELVPEVVEDMNGDGSLYGLIYTRMTPINTSAIQDLAKITIGTSSDAVRFSTTTFPTGLVPALASLADPNAPAGESTFISKVFARFRAWFADAANGISTFFAGEVHTERLCVGETCVTEVELAALLSEENVEPASSGDGESNEENSENKENEQGTHGEDEVQEQNDQESESGSNVPSTDDGSGTTTVATNSDTVSEDAGSESGNGNGSTEPQEKQDQSSTEETDTHEDTEQDEPSPDVEEATDDHGEQPLEETASESTPSEQIAEEETITEPESEEEGTTIEQTSPGED